MSSRLNVTWAKLFSSCLKPPTSTSGRESSMRVAAAIALISALRDEPPDRLLDALQRLGQVVARVSGAEAVMPAGVEIDARFDRVAVEAVREGGVVADHVPVVVRLPLDSEQQAE